MRAIMMPIALFVCTPAQADVVSATDQGFEISRSVPIAAAPARIYAAIGQPAKWWNKDHTWSGDAQNMTLALKAGGCFCERLPKDKGMVEHGRVIFAQPGKMLRLNAALGPLQGKGATGALTFAIKPEGDGAVVTLSYVVGGYLRPGPKAIAPAVDMVLGQQLAGLKALLEAKSPQ